MLYEIVCFQHGSPVRTTYISFHNIRKNGLFSAGEVTADQRCRHQHPLGGSNKVCKVLKGMGQ